ncbi:CHAT domain-containing protein [Streptomyces sp. NPDC003737]|uniref:CHAT domain-containing protein n=1 Tax=Streptomyces sp. NPDC003737 TaxID=3364685 RepID=UPI0036AFB789
MDAAESEVHPWIGLARESASWATDCVTELPATSNTERGALRLRAASAAVRDTLHRMWLKRWADIVSPLVATAPAWWLYPRLGAEIASAYKHGGLLAASPSVLLLCAAVALACALSLALTMEAELRYMRHRQRPPIVLVRAGSLLVPLVVCISLMSTQSARPFPETGMTGSEWARTLAGLLIVSCTFRWLFRRWARRHCLEPLDAVFLRLLPLTVDIGHSARNKAWATRRSAASAVGRLELAAVAAERVFSRRAPLWDIASRRDVRATGLQLAAQIRKHKAPLLRASGGSDFGKVAVSLTALLDAWAAPDWDALLANAPEVPLRSRLRPVVKLLAWDASLAVVITLAVRTLTPKSLDSAGLLCLFVVTTALLNVMGVSSLVRTLRDRPGKLATIETRLTATEGQVSMVLRELRAPKPEKLRVLMLGAASVGDLRVGREQARIRAAVEKALHRDLVELDVHPAATTDHLLDGLTRFRPHVVHFSGHSTQDLIVFEHDIDRRHKGAIVTVKAFARAIAAADEPPLLVLLNSCHSAAQTKHLLETVPFAIGMSDEIGDVDAITYAARFYASVADGQSIYAAHALGQAAVELNGLPDHDLPTLDHAPDVDPRSTFLVKPPQ